MIKLIVDSESWPIRGSFNISRGSKTSADVVMVTLQDGEYVGRGECVPYARYGESCASVVDQIESFQREFDNGAKRETLQHLMRPGAARNALDCALWDLEAKRSATRAWTLAGVPNLSAMITAYTLSLDTPEKMKAVAEDNAHRPLLKLKLAGAGDLERVEAVRSGAPKPRIIVDANEGWTTEIYQDLVPKLKQLGVEMIEQPLPADSDAVLAELERPIPICADESCHDRKSLPDLIGKYDMINIKLDKTGGLTEALALRKEAEAEGLQIMVGCMLATSLAMAPAMAVAKGAAVVDLDGPLLMEKDRADGMSFAHGVVHPPHIALWG